MRSHVSSRTQSARSVSVNTCDPSGPPSFLLPSVPGEAGLRNQPSSDGRRMPAAFSLTCSHSPGFLSSNVPYAFARVPLWCPVAVCGRLCRTSPHSPKFCVICYRTRGICVLCIFELHLCHLLVNLILVVETSFFSPRSY